MLVAAGLSVGLLLVPAQGGQDPVPRATRLERDQLALRERIERLESSGRHAELMAGVAALLARKRTRGENFIDLDGWCVGRHELSFLLEVNRPSPEDPEGPIGALDFEIENHALHVISGYARDLSELGIELLVVPIPNRVQVWHDLLPGARPREDGVGGDLGTARLLLALSEAGVEVVDLIPAFAAERARSEENEDARLYRRYNPHWAPHGVQVVADVLADRVRQMGWFERGPRRAGVDFVQRREHLQHRFSEHGNAPDEPPTFLFERVLDPSGKRVEQRDRESPFLILGDSYADIYRAEGAGIAVQLYARLGYTMDCIAVSNGGANSVWQSVARREGGLKGKKAVIWLFRMTEFDYPEFRKVQILGR